MMNPFKVSSTSDAVPAGILERRDSGLGPHGRVYSADTDAVYAVIRPLRQEPLARVGSHEPITAHWIEAGFGAECGRTLRRIAAALDRFDERDEMDRRIVGAPANFDSYAAAIAAVRFADPLGDLLISGVPILTCLDVCIELPCCRAVSAMFDEMRARIIDGGSISDCVRSFGVPPTVVRLIELSERNPVRLDVVLVEIGELHWAEVRADLEASGISL